MSEHDLERIVVIPYLLPISIAQLNELMKVSSRTFSEQKTIKNSLLLDSVHRKRLAPAEGEELGPV